MAATPKAIVRDGARTKRGNSRREMILSAAAELFRKHGFHGTGIDEIGAAVGITGPGVYRHFSGKHDLLAAVLERAVEGLRAALEGVLSSSATPEEALEGIVERTVAACIAERDLSAIYFQETRHLNPDDKARLGRTQRMMTEEWVHVLSQVRPELSDVEARASVLAVGRLINSVAHYDTGLEPAKLQRFLSEMAMGALMAPHDAQ